MCPTHKAEVIQRHNKIAQHFIQYVPRQWTVAYEQTFGNLKPDIVMRNTNTKKALIIDVKVCSDLHETYERNQREMEVKYEPIRRNLEREGLAASIQTLQFGVAGAAPTRTKSLLFHQLKFKPKHMRATIRKMTLMALESSRNVIAGHLGYK